MKQTKIYRKTLERFYLSALIFIAFAQPLFAQEGIQQAVMIIASNDFRDEELLIPKRMLESSKVKVILSSSSLAPANGVLGAVAKPDILIKDIAVADYDAIIFIGGSGAKEFWDDPCAHKIAIEAQKRKKVIAAICIAPVTLAKSKILAGKKATVWPGASKQLILNGANYTGSDLEVDENIITADGPGSSEKFAKAIISALVDLAK